MSNEVFPFADSSKSYECKFVVKSGRFVVKDNGKINLICAFENGVLFIKFYFDFRESPLEMFSVANVGDSASLILRPYRLELRINERLVNEEWPCGTPLYSVGTISGDMFPTVNVIPDDRDSNDSLPCILESVKGIEGIRINGTNIGDCMPFSDETENSDGRFHLFYLYDRHHHNSKWHLGAHQWAHCSTKDLKNWDIHPMAIGITDPIEGSICTGSVIKKDNGFVAWYAVRMADGSPALMTYATSDDGYHFHKSGKSFILPDAYNTHSARDPKVVFYENSYHMFVTTRHIASGKGCLAHLTSNDLENWQDAGMIWVSDDGFEPECPDWFKMGDKFYLICRLSNGTNYMYSDSPFGGWVLPENSRMSECGGVPKSALFNNRRIFFGLKGEGEYAGSAIATEAIQNDDGTLSFLPVEI